MKPAKAFLLGCLIVGAASALPVGASPVTASQLQRLVDEAIKGQPQDVAQCMTATIHYVWEGSRYEHVKWPKNDPDALLVRHYYHDGSQISEVTITAEGHVRDWKITDTYEPVRVSCMAIDNRMYRVEVEPAQS